VRIAQNYGVDHAETSEHHRRFAAAECLNSQSLEIRKVFPVGLMDIEQDQVALAADDSSPMLGQLPQERDDMRDEAVRQEIPKQRQGSHHYKGVLALQILGDSVVHEQAKFVTGFHQQCSEQVGHLFQVQIRRLAKIDRQNVGE
jgi:hypothetical protein